LGRSFACEVKDGFGVRDDYRVRGAHPGQRAKGFIDEIKKTAPHQGRGGALVKVERTIDRDTDRYRETVTMIESGEVIRSVDEPLSDHRGHGSAKFKAAPEDQSESD
jgi:hypothetical protein